MNLLKHLFAFIALGSLLYAADHAITGADKPAELQTIHIKPTDISLIENNFLAQAGHAPDEKELALAIEKHVDAEILLKEAVKLGIHHLDPVVRGRVEMNMQFLEQKFDEKRMFEDGITKGMIESDLVIRRRLIERMEKIIAGQFVAIPTDRQLQTFMEENSSLYSQTNQYQLFHVYLPLSAFSEKDAAALYNKWVGAQISDQALKALASHSFVGADKRISKRNLIKVFGSTLAGKIENMHANEVMPLAATETGFHMIRLLKISQGTLPELSLVRERVKQDYLKSLHKEAVAKTLHTLRSHYKVERAG